MVETLRVPGKQKFDPVPRWIGGRVKIARSAQDVYDFWRSSANLPKVIRVLQSVTIHDGGSTYWVLRGRSGQSLAFTCEQVIENVGMRIEWRATRDAPVHSSLNVTFHTLGDEMSELGVEWTVGMKPEHFGKTSCTLDGLLDDITQRMLDDDLDRLRTALQIEGERAREQALIMNEDDAYSE